MRENRGKFLLLKFITVLCLAGIIFVSMSVWKEIKKKKEIQNEITTLQQEAEKISRDNSSLEEKIAYLGSEDYKEKEAKDKLNLQSPGENVVVIKQNAAKIENSESKQDAIAPAPQEVIFEAANYKKWWNYFFKY
jgi:cell division protein FtsL